MIKKIGSNYGGWMIDLDLIPSGSNVISAGLGNDISFDEELIKLKDCTIIGIDPTLLSEKTIKRKKIESKNFIYVKRGLYKDDNGFEMSNGNTNGNSMFNVKVKTMLTISLSTIFKHYINISVLKMNIEGAEYPVILNLNEIPKIKQVCIRFHHRKDIIYSFAHTILCLNKFKEWNYEILYESNPNNKKVDYEVLLCKKK